MSASLSASVFDYDDYKHFLLDHIKALPNKGYGFKSRIATAIGCKTAYVSQVISGTANFSLEQGEDLNRILKHSEAESDYFLLQIQLARAGTQHLRHRIQTQMESLRDRNRNLKRRFQIRDEVSEKVLLEFFSRWYISAVHLGAMVPRLKNSKNLMSALGIDQKTFDEALKFLISHGLMKIKTGLLEPGPKSLFIGKDSPILKMHHMNWRHKSMEALDRGDPKDVHFTSLYCLSAKDATQIRESLIREIERVRTVVKSSPEEELHTLTVDFFRVDKR